MSRHSAMPVFFVFVSAVTFCVHYVLSPFYDKDASLFHKSCILFSECVLTVGCTIAILLTLLTILAVLGSWISRNDPNNYLTRYDIPSERRVERTQHGLSVEELLQDPETRRNYEKLKKDLAKQEQA